MECDIRKITGNLLKNREQKLRWYRRSCVAAVLTVSITTYSMILPASALSWSELSQNMFRSSGGLTATSGNAEREAGPRRKNKATSSNAEKATSSNALPEKATPGNATSSNATSSNAGRRLGYEDDDIKVSVRVPDGVTLPEDAWLFVEPILEDHEDYQALMSGAEDKTDERGEAILFYNIDIVDGHGEVVEIPDMDLEVTFKKKKIARNDKITVLQYDESKTAKILREEDIDLDTVLDGDSNFLVQLFCYIKGIF